MTTNPSLAASLVIAASTEVQSARDERDRARDVAVALEQQAAAVLTLVVAAEHAALSVRDPRPVPAWCTAIRRALDETGRGCGCLDCETSGERAARTAERAGEALESAWNDKPWGAR